MIRALMLILNPSPTWEKIESDPRNVARTFFLFRMFDALPSLNTWVCWGVGIALSVAALYRGIPRVMKPDPSNALGLYLLCSLLLTAISGVTHFLANLILQQKLLAG